MQCCLEDSASAPLCMEGTELEVLHMRSKRQGYQGLPLTLFYLPAGDYKCHQVCTEHSQAEDLLCIQCLHDCNPDGAGFSPL